MKGLKSVKFIALVMVMALVVAACGNGNSKSSGSSTTGGSTGTSSTAEPIKELKSVKVGILKMAALTNVYAADKEGMFEKNGLKAELIEFQNGSEAINAQQSGSVDIILTIPGNGFTAIERGFDLKAIFQNESAKAAGPDSNSIQVSADSDIQSVSDLAGKSLAVSTLHSQGTVAVQKVIKNAGLDISKVNFIELPLSSMADALRNKQVDAVAVPDPFTTQMITAGIGKVISWNYVESVPEQPVGVWFAKGTYIKDNPEVINAFTVTIKESIDYMMEDEARSKANVAEFTGLDPSLVESMPLLAWSYDVSKTKWQQVIDMMVESGEMSKATHAEDYFAESIKAYVID